MENLSNLLHSNLQIAARAATVHEAVSRSIKKMRELGILEYTRAHITITNPAKLAILAQATPILLKNS